MGTSKKTSRKKLIFTKMKCGKKSKIPCYCAERKKNKLKRSVCLKKACSNRNIDVRVGDYYRILRERSSIFGHTFIEIENKRNKCIYNFGFNAYEKGTPWRASKQTKTELFKTMAATHPKAKTLKKKYLPYGKQPTLILQMKDRSTMSKTTKYKKLYSNIGKDQVHTRKQKRGKDDWGYLTQDHVDFINFFKDHSYNVKQYKNRNDKNTYLTLDTGLTYSGWSKWPREFTTLAYTALFGVIASAVNPLLLAATPLIASALYKKFSSVKDKINSYNCILGAFAFHKKPKKLLDEIKKNMKPPKSKKKSKNKTKKKNK